MYIRRLLAVLCAVILVVCACACADNTNDVSTSVSSSPVQNSEPEPENHHSTETNILTSTSETNASTSTTSTINKDTLTSKTETDKTDEKDAKTTTEQEERKTTTMRTIKRTSTHKTKKTTRTFITTTETTAPSNTTTKSKRPPATANMSESPLSNTYKLLTTGDKKLTVGYFGGSITLGTHAVKDGGSISLSWANRTTDWLKKNFPNAEITSINAGISDTATNIGLYRLETTLMNTDGHDMPDLVFVEFTSNDWTYETQGEAELRIQIESLFRNIWHLNPAAEIVTVISQREESVTSRKIYIEVSEYYGIPIVDAGAAMKTAMKERGSINEANGYYYYTTDNLHPSWRGYELYLNETVKIFEEHLLDLKLKSTNLYPYGEYLPKAMNNNLITSPRFIDPAKLNVTGDAEILSFPINGDMYHLTPMIQQKIPLTTYHHHLYIEGNTTIKTTFSGTTLGAFICPSPTGFNIRWRVDGGEWKSFTVNSKSRLSFALYDHPVVFMLEHTLGKGAHTLEMQFLAPTDGGSLQLRLGGIAVNG